MHEHAVEKTSRYLLSPCLRHHLNFLGHFGEKFGTILGGDGSLTILLIPRVEKFLHTRDKIWQDTAALASRKDEIHSTEKKRGSLSRLWVRHLSSDTTRSKENTKIKGDKIRNDSYIRRGKKLNVNQKLYTRDNAIQPLPPTFGCFLMNVLEKKCVSP